MKNKHVRLWTVLTSLAFTVLILGALLLLFADFSAEEDSMEWVTYSNTEFNFEIKHPLDWRVDEFLDDEIIPRVNFYPQNTEVVQPVTHHSEVPNLSIFPQGVPTEGVFGETKESEISLSFDFNEVTDFVLSDGTVWATYARVGNFPSAGWNQSGFIWARVEIENLELSCLREDIIPMEECDPLTGDLLIRDGLVSAGERIIQRSMLKSFKPLNGDPGPLGNG